MKKINLLALLLSALFLCGCSTLTYTGEDFNKENIKAITTTESLYFSTYQKTVEEGINVRTGVTKTHVDSVLAIYLEVENKSSASFQVNPDDVKITIDGRNAARVSTAEYISAYQSMQNEIYAGGQSLSATVNNFATITNNYQNMNQSLLLRDQNNAESSMKQISDYISGIRAHALNSTVNVKTGDKKYFYIFIEDDGYPVNVDFRGVQYSFGKAAK